MAKSDTTVTYVTLEQFELVTKRLEALEAQLVTKPATAAREMTDADAVRILSGDLAQSKHKDAASALGLSYGQIYSCRLEFTFKHVHKAMKTAGTPNPWMK